MDIIKIANYSMGYYDDSTDPFAEQKKNIDEKQKMISESALKHASKILEEEIKPKPQGMKKEMNDLLSHANALF